MSMYPLGHFAVSYFTVNLMKPIVDEDYNLFLVWFISVLPDFDIFLSSIVVHRGSTHSLVAMIVLFTPFYLYYRRGFKYLAALLSHSLIGDYFTAYGVQLFWPLNNRWYVASSLYRLSGLKQFRIELLLFALMLIHLWYARYRAARARRGYTMATTPSVPRGAPIELDLKIDAKENY